MPHGGGHLSGFGCGFPRHLEFCASRAHLLCPSEMRTFSPREGAICPVPEMSWQPCPQNLGLRIQPSALPEGHMAPVVMLRFAGATGLCDGCACVDFGGPVALTLPVYAPSYSRGLPLPWDGPFCTLHARLLCLYWSVPLGAPWRGVRPHAEPNCSAVSIDGVHA